MDITRPPMSEAARNRLEQKMYPEGNISPKSMKAGPKNALRAGYEKGEMDREGMELDRASQSLREVETSRGWATRQGRTLHKEMRSLLLIPATTKYYRFVFFSQNCVE